MALLLPIFVHRLVGDGIPRACLHGDSWNGWGRTGKWISETALRPRV